MDHNTLALQSFCDQFRYVLILERKDPFRSIDQVDLGLAQIAEDGGEFATDDTGTDDDDALRQPIDVEDAITRKDGPLVDHNAS